MLQHRQLGCRDPGLTYRPHRPIHQAGAVSRRRNCQFRGPRVTALLDSRQQLPGCRPPAARRGWLVSCVNPAGGWLRVVQVPSRTNPCGPLRIQGQPICGASGSASLPASVWALGGPRSFAPARHGKPESVRWRRMPGATRRIGAPRVKGRAGMDRWIAAQRTGRPKRADGRSTTPVSRPSKRRVLETQRTGVAPPSRG